MGLLMRQSKWYEYDSERKWEDRPGAVEPTWPFALTGVFLLLSPAIFSALAIFIVWAAFR